MTECGAKTRSGGTCRKPAMANGRCRLHGGASPGAPKGNQNALKHGIYAKVLSAEDRETMKESNIGSLDDELMVARLQLQRALKAQADADQKGDALAIESVVNTQEGENKHIVERRERQNFDDAIYKLLGRIGDLETKRAEMLRKPVDPGDETPTSMTFTVNVVDASAKPDTQ